mmetsp:Transcript_14894/g.30099  ORF Transcript_14894/g.30099 Transcript_14894/m.30099 type:complete len:111 (+) Transcript_14894:354-686(+)
MYKQVRLRSKEIFFHPLFHTNQYPPPPFRRTPFPANGTDCMCMYLQVGGMAFDLTCLQMNQERHTRRGEKREEFELTVDYLVMHSSTDPYKSKNRPCTKKTRHMNDDARI